MQTFYCIHLQNIRSDVCQIRCPRCSQMAWWKANRYDYVYLTKNELLPFTQALQKEPRKTIATLDRGAKKYRFVVNQFPQLSKSQSCSGIMECPSCGLQQEKFLQWPQDAYFQIEHRGHILWAYSKQHFLDILAFIKSKQRDAFVRNFMAQRKSQTVTQEKPLVPERYSLEKWRFPHAGESFLRLPRVFICAKNRDTLVKKMEKFLRSC